MDSQEPKQPTTAPVMDIQPPRPQSPTTPPAPNEEVTVPTEPIATPPVADTEMSDANDALNPVTTDPETATPLVATQSAQASHHHKAPIGAIVTALVVAIALAGAAVFTFMQQNKEPAQPVANTSQTTQTPAVTTKDVDETTQAVDESLNKIDDATDFDSNVLSDTSLSL